MNKYIKEEVRNFRSRLRLDVPPFSSIEDEYFSLIISRNLNNHTTKFLSKYGLWSPFGGFFDELEWLGDSILEVSVRQYLFQHYRDKYSQEYLIKVKTYIVQNYTLYCLLLDKDICPPAPTKKARKRCADRLESTIGLLYYYFNDIMQYILAFDTVYDWFINTFHIDQIIADFTKGKILPCLQSLDKEIRESPDDVIELIEPPEEEIIELIEPPEEEIVELLRPPDYSDEDLSDEFNEEVELYPIE